MNFPILPCLTIMVSKILEDDFFPGKARFYKFKLRNKYFIVNDVGVKGMTKKRMFKYNQITGSWLSA